jgi:hypothetical protein
MPGPWQRGDTGVSDAILVPEVYLSGGNRTGPRVRSNSRRSTVLCTKP